VIESPVDRQQIGGEDDDACAERDACWLVDAKGWVPEGRAGIFAVEPLRASPAVWIQPFAPGASGGSVVATVNLGRKLIGAKEWFRIYLLSCVAEHTLVAEETSFEEIDKYCTRSEPVTVYRVR
jgi:hypothetical protein